MILGTIFVLLVAALPLLASPPEAPGEITITPTLIATAWRHFPIIMGRDMGPTPLPTTPPPTRTPYHTLTPSATPSPSPTAGATASVAAPVP